MSKTRTRRRVTAVEASELILAMSPDERDRLLAWMAEESDKPWLRGYRVLTPGQVEATTNGIRNTIEYLASKREAAESRLTPYKTGPQTKRDRVHLRNEEIAKLCKVGITEPDEILQHLIEQHPHLVRLGGPRSTKFIKVASLMTAFESCSQSQ